MKYYTKDWYNLMQKCDYTLAMKKIPDKAYSEDEIKTFYNKALKKEIALRRERYNDQPDYTALFDMLDENDFDPIDWVLIDESKGIGRFPQSKEEVRAFYEAEKKRKEQEFINRGPFNATSVADDFKSLFKHRLKLVVDEFPKWTIEHVDLRLLALNLLPVSVYDRLKQEERRNQKEYNRVTKLADNAVWEEYSKLPEKIQTNFGFNDDCVLGFRKKNRDYEMLLRSAGSYCLEGETLYKRVLFRNATLLEKDNGIICRPYHEDGMLYSNCRFLNDEIYRLKDRRYEVHMMVYCNGLKYITLQCEDIQFDDNIEFL